MNHQPTPCEKLPVTATKAELVEAHRNKMSWKRGHRAAAWTPLKGVPASINRRTGKPHEHVSERARRTGIPC